MDACDRVVRMWEWDWQAPRDYGTRYDLGLLETCRTVLVRFKKHNKRQPRLGWLVSRLRYLADEDVLLPTRALIVNQRQWLWSAAGVAIGGCGATGNWELTRGSIAACWALTSAKPGDQVVLVGFDNIQLGVTLAADKAFSKECQSHPGFWGLKDYAGNKDKEGNHDFLAERRLLELLAADAGVSLSFAQDVWA